VVIGEMSELLAVRRSGILLMHIPQLLVLDDHVYLAFINIEKEVKVMTRGSDASPSCR